MNIQAALATYAPKIAERFVHIHTRAFESVTEHFGEAHHGVYNSSSGKFYRESLARFCKRDGNRMNDPARLDVAALNAAAEKYAAAVVAEWKEKIDAKVGELTGAEVLHAGETNFIIIGQRNGRNIRIEQQMILNVSTKGTLFNQFPARIYVDGKFVSAKAYAAI